tara:strand:- start:265 stop:444 length:180 start_codon:yes stop_codon:yes gene_type:complete
MKFKITQTYTQQDIYENVEADTKEEAVLKLDELFHRDKFETHQGEIKTEVSEQLRYKRS